MAAEVVLAGVILSRAGLTASIAGEHGSARQVGVPLKPYTETIPGSVVKIDMIAIPAGMVAIAPADPKAKTETAQVKPFWIAKTETTWEAFDAFTSSGPPSP